MNDGTVLIGIGAAPIITALIQAAKAWLPDRAEPIVAVVLGVLWNVGFTAGTDEFGRATVFLGIVTGLAASGLYSAGQSVAGLRKSEE